MADQISIEKINQWKAQLNFRITFLLKSHWDEIPFDFYQNLMFTNEPNYRIQMLMIFFWNRLAMQSCHEYSSYPDFLIRRVLINPCSINLGYFCLLISKYISWTEFLSLTIASSKDLVPILPYSQEELKILVEVAGNEDRLRLATLLAFEFGKFSNQYNYYPHFIDFPSGFTAAFDYFGIEKFELLIECLLASSKCLQFYFFCGPSYLQGSGFHISSNTFTLNNSPENSSTNILINQPIPIRGNLQEVISPVLPNPSDTPGPIHPSEDPEKIENLTQPNNFSIELLSHSQLLDLSDPFAACLVDPKILKLNENFLEKEPIQQQLKPIITDYDQLVIEEGQREYQQHCEQLYDELFEGMC